MKIGDFTNNFKLMQGENKWGRIIITGCMLVIFIMSIGLVNKKPIITLVPPQLSEKSELHHNKATSGAHQAWGLYLAESLGNVTPSSAAFLRETLEPLLSPQIRNEALVLLDKQIDIMKRDQVSFSYEPRSVTFDAVTGTVYVTGRHSAHAVAGDKPAGSYRTYEFRWKFKNYMPSLVYIDTYEKTPSIK